MSRVGKKVIEIPKDVKVNVTESEVAVEGPKGKLAVPIPRQWRINFKQEERKLTAEAEGDEYADIHGTARALVANAVTGVSKGFTQEMDVVGVGYKVELRGRAIHFALGYSHPIEFVLPEGVTAKVEKLQRTISQYQTTITLSSIDKHLLGQTAANMHKLRKPDAYKGQGGTQPHPPIKIKPGKARQ